MTRRKCPHPETWAEDGTPSARLWCGICGEVLIQPPGWQPAVPRYSPSTVSSGVASIHARCPSQVGASASPARTSRSR